MTFSQSILSELQHRFLVAFQIANYVNEDRFAITFAGDDSNSVVMDLLIKSDSRLKLILHTGNYAADILHLMESAADSRKDLFVKYWQQMNNKICCKTKVLIGGKQVEESDFTASDHSWGAFNISFESFPFYDPDDDNRVEVVADHVCNLWAMLLSLIPYTIEGKEEGTTYEKTITTHERNPINRQLCLQLKGYACAVCGLKFEDVYGSIGHNYIEIHHTNPVAEMGENHVVDIVNELVPLCSNCHSMVHRRKPPYSVEELRAIILKQQSSKDEKHRSKPEYIIAAKVVELPSLNLYETEEDAESKYIIPLYTIRAACGKFLYNEEAEVKGWIDAEEYGLPHGDNIFVVQAKGHSMEPKIKDGDYCVFAYGTSFYNGDIILAEIPDKDSEYGGSFTIKKYTREKAVVDGVEQKVSVTLVPLNPDYEPMSFDLESEEKPNMVGTFRKVIRL
ncbi:MAG: HNH endonuclease [Bacteroidales bacterium]|nr:HNH endonuclease [Bacteroidales bacterium]